MWRCALGLAVLAASVGVACSQEAPNDPPPKAAERQPWQDDFEALCKDLDKVGPFGAKEHGKKLEGKPVAWKLKFVGFRDRTDKVELEFDLTTYGIVEPKKAKGLNDPAWKRPVIMAFEPAAAAVAEWKKLKSGTEVTVQGVFKNAFWVRLNNNRDFAIVDIGDVTIGGKRGGGKKAIGKLYKSPAELFADMPEDAHPKGGADGTPERVAAREWMKKNRVGHELEWTAAIKDVSISEAGAGFFVRFDLDLVRCVDIQDDARLYVYWGKPITFGKDTCQATVAGGYSFGPVDAATAKKLREWKGKKAAFRAAITGVEFEEGKNGRVINPTDLSALPACYAVIRITPPTIDGYAPPLVGAANQAADQIQQERKALSGLWVEQFRKSKGFITKIDGIALGMRFAGDKVTSVRMIGGQVEELQAGTYKIDLSKNPKTIDLTLEAKDGKSTSRFGIYELKGDILRMSFNKAGNNERPTAFDDTKAPIEFYKR